MSVLTHDMNEVLYKTPQEIETWLLNRTGKRLSRQLLRWIVLDALFDRQNGRCAICQHELGSLIDIDLDHKVRRSQGGTDTMDNLQLLCVGCHRRKTRHDRKK